MASEEWIEFGMEAQRRHAQPFVRICNTNRGVAKVSRAALGRVGISVDVLEREGYLGDPSVKGSLRILPRVVAARPRSHGVVCSSARLPCVYGYGCTVRRTQGLSL